MAAPAASKAPPAVATEHSFDIQYGSPASAAAAGSGAAAAAHTTTNTVTGSKVKGGSSNGFVLANIASAALGQTGIDQKGAKEFAAHPNNASSPQPKQTTAKFAAARAAIDVSGEFNILPVNLIEEALAFAAVKSCAFNIKFLELFLAQKGLPKDLFATGFTNLPKIAAVDQLALPNELTRYRINENPTFYYNANVVLKGTAIAAASPSNDEEIFAFWTGLVLWGNVSTIVTLDNGFFWPRCGLSTNFPDNGVSVLCVSEQMNIIGDYCLVERQFRLTYPIATKELLSNTVTQYHLIGWPEKGVITKEALAGIVEAVTKQRSSSKDASIHQGPLLVHCSNGIGATGTFLAAYEAYRKLNKHPTSLISLFKIASSLRDYRTGRNGSIQTSQQYELVHEAFTLLKQNLKTPNKTQVLFNAKIPPSASGTAAAAAAGSKK